MNEFLISIITTVIGVTITVVLKNIFKKFKWSWIFYFFVILLTFAYYNNTDYYHQIIYAIFIYLFLINIVAYFITKEENKPLKYVIYILIPLFLFFIKNLNLLNAYHIKDIINYCNKPLSVSCLNYLKPYENFSYYILFHINNFLFIVYSLKYVDALTSYNRNIDKFFKHEKISFILLITSSNILFIILDFIFYTINYVTK